MLKDDIETVEHFIGKCSVSWSVGRAMTRIKEALNSLEEERPDNCDKCRFRIKCKNLNGIDYAYGGLECTLIWKNSREEESVDNMISDADKIGWDSASKWKELMMIRANRLKGE